MLFRKKQSAGGLYIIIVGCGKVGRTLTQQLTQEGHDITLIDQRPQIIQELTNLYDVMGIVGNGASFSVQKEAGIEDADLLIAVTDSDELNLLCCTVANQVGECAAIARVRNPDYSEEIGYLREKLGLAMIINPELEAAKETARILYLPTALEVNSFAHGQAELVQFKVPKGNILCDKTVAHLGKNITNDILICAIERSGDVHIPSGDSLILAGDVISFISTPKSARHFLEEIGFNTRQVRSTLIIGGGKSAYYLAVQLIKAGITVKIIENDFRRCEELSILLPDAIIINGDGTDQELLREAGIESAESFVPLTEIDEENIMLTLHAKQVSDAKVITKINRITFTDVINQLDLGSVIYPKYITAEAIIAYVRAKSASKESANIETLYHMFDQRMEAIEFRVPDNSKVTGIPLKDLALRKNLLIACIVRRGRTIIPGGMDDIRLDDTVVVVTTQTGLSDIESILK